MYSEEKRIKCETPDQLLSVRVLSWDIENKRMLEYVTGRRREERRKKERRKGGRKEGERGRKERARGRKETGRM